MSEGVKMLLGRTLSRVVRASHADRMAHAMGVIQLPWELFEDD